MAKPKSTESTKSLKSPLVVHEVFSISIGELIEDEDNPRTIDEDERERLIRSIEEYGFVEPFVARKEDRRIVGGHQRAGAIFEYLKRHGIKPAQAKNQIVTAVLVPGLSESRCRALNLALNKIGGEFDFLRMPQYLTKIEAPDLELTGFSQSELDDIVQLTSSGGKGGGGGLDPDSYLSDMKLAFAFKVSNQDEADLCRRVLKTYGMTGPKDAAMAFIRALTAAEKKA